MKVNILEENLYDNFIDFDSYFCSQYVKIDFILNGVNAFKRLVSFCSYFIKQIHAKFWFSRAIVSEI